MNLGIDSECQRAFYSEDYVEFVVEQAFAEFVPLKEKCYYPIDDDIGILLLKTENAETLLAENYGPEMMPKIYGITDERSAIENGNDYLRASGSLQVQSPPLSLTGEKVILGVIDTGIDYTSAAFRNEDGSTRILALWDQTAEQSLILEDGHLGEPDNTEDSAEAWNIPVNVPYGTVYEKEDIDKALKGNIVNSTDTNGHGTAMADAAAGNGRDRKHPFPGAAPNAELVIVKLRPAKRILRDYYFVPENQECYQESDILTAAKFVASFVKPGQTAVTMVLGISNTLTNHSGTGLLSSYLNRLTEKKNLLAFASGGNEGNGAGHYAGLFGETRAVAEFRVGAAVKGICMEIGGQLPGLFEVAIKAPGGETTPYVSPKDGRRRSFRFIYEKAAVSFWMTDNDQNSGRQAVFMRLENPSPGIWTIYLRNMEKNPIANIYLNRFHIWMTLQKYRDEQIYFLEPSPDVTITEPGNASGVFTINGYNSRRGSFMLQSGRGFTADGVIKPEVTAPGTDISTIVGSFGGNGMAAAVAAGISAQFLQWAVTEKNRPLIAIKEVKSLFVRSAVRMDEDIYPNVRWGFGRMDIQELFRILAEN